MSLLLILLVTLLPSFSRRLFPRAFLPLFLILLLPGCEKEVFLDHRTYTPKIVMNGILSPDSLVEIRVSKSFLYTDTLSSRSLLDDASLTLFINGEERGKMQQVRIDTLRDYNWRGNNTAYTALFRSSVRPKIGDKVRIEASAEGFPTAWAETILLAPPIITGVDTSTFLTSKSLFNDDAYSPYYDYTYPQLYPENIQVEEQYRNLRVNMGVTADSDVSQYFHLRVSQLVEHPDLREGNWKRYFYIYSDNDPIFDENYQRNILEDLITEGIDTDGRKNLHTLLFSNKLFRNRQYTLDFSVSAYYYVHTVYEEVKNENNNETGWGYWPPVTYIPLHTEVLNPPIDVELTLFSSELYSYYKKLNQSPYQDENPLVIISEPEVTFSNVHNGIGIIGAASTAKARIDIPPFPGGKNQVPRNY